MLKRAMRKGVRMVRKWLQEDRSAQPEPLSSPPREFSYDWLNRLLFPKTLAEGGGTLRPHYTWGVLQGANLARALDLNRVSVMEFGVAGGNGLIALEKTAQKIEANFGVAIDVYGFDTGVGLPKPQDHRDLPNIYTEGRHAMDVEKLQQRLQRAQLKLGLVENTVADFMQSEPAPVAFMAVDLDYYSATMHALQLLDAPQNLLLPRIYCYFDDIMGLTCGDHNGERLAITEFNASHAMRKISPIYGLKYFLPSPHADQIWTDQFFMAHIFDHNHYGRFDGQAPLHDTRLMATLLAAQWCQELMSAL
jgi:hypothetical protein